MESVVILKLRFGLRNSRATARSFIPFPGLLLTDDNKAIPINSAKVEAPRLRQAIRAIGPFFCRFSLNRAPNVTSPYDASIFEMHEDGIQFRRRLGLTKQFMHFGPWDVKKRSGKHNKRCSCHRIIDWESVGGEESTEARLPFTSNVRVITIFTFS